MASTSRTALLDRRDELAGDRAALDLVDELEAGAARQRLDAQEHLAELAGAAALLLVPMVALGRRGDRLAVGDPRRPRRHLEAIGLAQPLEQDAQVQLAEAVDDRLVGAGDVLELQAGILVDELGQDLPHALLVAVALGLDRQAVHGLGKRHRREVDVIVLGGVVEDGVEADLVDLGDGDDVARQRLRDLDVVLALEHEEVGDLERLPAVADVEQALLRDRALVDAEHAEPADEGIDRHLEDVGEHVPPGSGNAGGHRLGGRALAAQERRADSPRPDAAAA